MPKTKKTKKTKQNQRKSKEQSTMTDDHTREMNKYIKLDVTSTPKSLILVN